ncbi:MAG: hypothetical protein ACK4Z9_06205 [Thermodesulfovibrionales bacterium]
MSPSITETNWVDLARKRNPEVFSELDTFLKATDRFFNTDNLPISREDLTNRNFYHELIAVREVILRIVSLLEMVIPEGKRNVYWFQKFAQTKLLSDRKRDALREELYRQDTPEKSLLLLYDSFVNLKGLVSDIIRTEHIPFLTFSNIGQLIGKEIGENIFFNPFKKEIDPDIDVIDNREVSRIVKSITDKEAKKYVSLILLNLFKLLRYLRSVDNSQRFGSLSAAAVILILIRSEIEVFRGYLDRSANSIKDNALSMLFKAIGYQFSMESKRVYNQELKEIFRNRSISHLKAKIENSHGILKNLSEQSVIQIVQFFAPNVKGEDVFESFITRLEQSLKLRDDIIILEKFLKLFEDSKSMEDRHKVFDAMINYMLYFQSFTFRLLRYEDYEEFSSFFDKVLSLGRGINESDIQGLLEEVHKFRIFVETCIRQISNRAELLNIPPDMNKIDDNIRQYLQ